jgi:hypothetical protein
MSEDRDLLPWILGALSMAAMAMAIAVGLTGRTLPAHASGPTTTLAPTPATAELNPRAANTAPSGSAQSPPAQSLPAQSTGAQSPPTQSSAAQGAGTAPAQALAASDPPGDQIWECTIDGVKTFSNKRCGTAAVLRDVGPINVMDPAPVASNVHWYGPNSNDAPDYYYSDAPQPVESAYPVVVGIPYLERRRPEHPHQPTRHVGGHPRGH